MSDSLSIEVRFSVYEHQPLRELSVGECDVLLRRHRVGRVGIRNAEGVYVVPISFAYAHGHIYAHAAPGRKLALMRRWPHVAFQIDELESLSQWRSVLVQGKFEEITDEAEKQEARLILVAAFGGSLMQLTAGHGHRVSLADAILFRIRPEEITGRAQGY
ncbi:MAG: pyridoxamine 5'-phosphate oxidase family protein [Dehalococcoidia bacterium]|nr:pyridoxamine 5'-phosphate oxidase family protein [Dehalococcoidia bacterium]